MVQISVQLSSADIHYENAENVAPPHLTSTTSTISFGGGISVSPADSASNVTHRLSSEEILKREEAFRGSLREENLA